MSARRQHSSHTRIFLVVPSWVMLACCICGYVPFCLPVKVLWPSEKATNSRIASGASKLRALSKEYRLPFSLLTHS
jgi:hypothetical protein